MKIVEKMARKAKDNWNEPGVTIAFLGDSVTQGCFELYRKGEDGFETYFDKNGAYHLPADKIDTLLNTVLVFHLFFLYQRLKKFFERNYR